MTLKTIEFSRGQIGNNLFNECWSTVAGQLPAPVWRGILDTLWNDLERVTDVFKYQGVWEELWENKR